MIKANYPAPRSTTQDLCILILARLFLFVAEGMKGSLTKQIAAKNKRNHYFVQIRLAVSPGSMEPTEAESNAFPGLFLLLCLSPGPLLEGGLHCLRPLLQVPLGNTVDSRGEQSPLSLLLNHSQAPTIQIVQAG